MGINFQGVSSFMALLAFQNFATKSDAFTGGGVIVTIESIRVVAARTGVQMWLQGAVGLHGGQCYELLTARRRPECNYTAIRESSQGQRAPVWGYFHVSLEVGARASPLLPPGPTPQPAPGVSQGAPEATRPAGGLPVAAGLPEEAPCRHAAAVPGWGSTEWSIFMKWPLLSLMHLVV